MSECWELVEIIRQNYTDLYEQKQQEKEKFQEQLEVLRKMSEFSIEELENKYAEHIKTEQDRMRKYYENRMEVLTLQMEGQLIEIKNLMHEKKHNFDEVMLSKVTMETRNTTAQNSEVFQKER